MFDNPSITEILPGLYRVEMPLPGIPLPSVNSYIVKGSRRNLIVDPGLNHDMCFTLMRGTLQKLSIDPAITDFFFTHAHLDHAGLVTRLRTPQSEIYIGHREARHIDFDWDGTIRFATAHGFPKREIPALLSQHPAYTWTKSRSDLHLPFHLLEEKSDLAIGKYVFEILETPGHSRGHLCLYECKEKILICGDHILKDITPTIQLWAEGQNPLWDYVGSLDKIQELDVRLVLPGHGLPFLDCRKRVREINSHRVGRSQEVISVVSSLKSGTAYDIASKLTWNVQYGSWEVFPILQRWLSMGETLAHIYYCERKGLLQKLVGKDLIQFSCSC